MLKSLQQYESLCGDASVVDRLAEEELDQALILLAKRSVANKRSFMFDADDLVSTVVRKLRRFLELVPHAGWPMLSTQAWHLAHQSYYEFMRLRREGKAPLSSTSASGQDGDIVASIADALVTPSFDDETPVEDLLDYYLVPKDSKIRTILLWQACNGVIPRKHAAKMLGMSEGTLLRHLYDLQDRIERCGKSPFIGKKALEKSPTSSTTWRLQSSRKMTRP